MEATMAGSSLISIASPHASQSKIANKAIPSLLIAVDELAVYFGIKIATWPKFSSYYTEPCSA
jgi:hypothetical protein